nr:IS5 family transposase [Actinomadura bangladeshensis]
MTDEQWAWLALLLPVPRRPGRPSKWTKRQLIDGIRWRVRVGAPWRDVPACYGSWQAVYSLLRRWQRDGTWANILARLQAEADAAGLIGWQVGIDSTVLRAHQHAAGARRDGQTQAEPPGGTTTEPGDHALGRSRGGLSTKLHLACEQGHKPLSLVVTAGQRGDAPQFEAVMAGIRVARLGGVHPRTRPERVRADNLTEVASERAVAGRTPHTAKVQHGSAHSTNQRELTNPSDCCLDRTPDEHADNPGPSSSVKGQLSTSVTFR